jgi:hypothetical protein
MSFRKYPLVNRTFIATSVHGEVPFELLRDAQDGPKTVARFGYLAETVAREALLHAILDPALNGEFASRARIESAWETGRFS